VFREPKAEVLDLGPLCGSTVVYLAGRGARVHVEELEIPSPRPERKPNVIVEDPPPVRLDQPDGRAHLVLAWEMLDFVPPDRLAEVGAELRRVTRAGGMLFLFSQAKPLAEREPVPRYTLLADDMVVRDPAGVRSLRRWAHPTREIERALAGFAIQGIHLQRNQMREITALRSAVG
jgi:hypothetical protein